MQRVLLLVGTARDSELTQELLERRGIPAFACKDERQLRHEIEDGAGIVLIAEECLAEGGHDALLHAVSSQPAWSDLPILVLARPGSLLVQSLDCPRVLASSVETPRAAR